MIFITGDMHIPIDIHKLSSKAFKEQKSLSKSDYLIICGDFEKAFGVSKAHLPSYLNNVVSKGRIIKSTTKTIGNKVGYERIYYYKGNHYVVTGIGSNGFIVSAYPKSIR